MSKYFAWNRRYFGNQNCRGSGQALPIIVQNNYVAENTNPDVNTNISYIQILIIKVNMNNFFWQHMLKNLASG